MARTQKKFLCLRGFNQYLSRILSLGRCPLLPGSGRCHRCTYSGRYLVDAGDPCPPGKASFQSLHLRQYHLHCGHHGRISPASNCTAYRRWRHARPHPSLCRAQRRQFLCAARRVPPGIPAAALPSSANLSPRTDQLRHIDFGCRSRDSGLPLLSCAAFGPLQPGHPLCRGAGRLSAGGLGRYAFPLRCPGRIPSQWNWHGAAGQALAPRNGSFLTGQKLFLILYSFFHFSLR